MAAIIFNGKPYNSIEEMPANERQAYAQMMQIFEDKDGNGIPDFLEGDMMQKLISANSTKVVVSGGDVHNLDELSPELRQKVETAFQMMTKFGLIPGVPSELQTPLAGREPVMQSRPFVSREYSPVIQEEGGSNFLPWVSAGGVLLLCLLAAAIGVFYIYYLTQ
jgi:hypothetical protein